jgi:hypothetical protein
MMDRHAEAITRNQVYGVHRLHGWLIEVVSIVLPQSQSVD